MTDSQTDLITDFREIADIGQRIAESGRFAMDLEFVSADRYVPDLALVQLAWTEGGKDRLALVEAVDTDLSSLWELVASEAVLLVSHGAKQDLTLLSTRFGVQAQGFIDTQVAAAFAGIGEQIGYAHLVEDLTKVVLDKGSQFTNWLRRPLSAKQLRYALDDVRYLLAVWDKLHARLKKLGRLGWAEEESAAVARLACERRPSEEAYLAFGGIRGLKPEVLGALRALAAWRQEQAIGENTPPSWILTDAAVLELCRRKNTRPGDLRRIRGVSETTVRRYGEQILSVIKSGKQHPIELPKVHRPLTLVLQAQAAVVTAIVSSRASEIGISPRTIAARADAEALVRHLDGSNAVEDLDCKLLTGWRMEAAGGHALQWLRGKKSLIVDPAIGVRVQ